MVNSPEKAGERLLPALFMFVHIPLQCPVCKADVTQPHGSDPEPVSNLSQGTDAMLHPTPTSNATERTPLLPTNNNHDADHNP
jgi:hypothetical protein